MTRADATNWRYLPVLALLAFATTCAQPQPKPPPPQGTADRPPAVAELPDEPLQTAEEAAKPVVAPTRRSKRRPGARVALPPGVIGTKPFDHLTTKMELFSFPVRAGVFSFCLSGTKPKLDPLFFQVLIRRGKSIYRLDGVQGVAAEEGEFSACASMSPDEEAAPLKEGEIVTVASTWDTRGPLVLTLTMEELPPP